jgi:hypothetical protein
MTHRSLYDFMTRVRIGLKGRKEITGILLNWCHYKRGVWQTEVKRRVASLCKIQKVRVSCSNIAALIMAACFENLVNRILLRQTSRTIV